MSVRLAIDAMGGDHGLTVTVPAALSFLQSHPDAHLLLVGRPDEVEAALQQQLSRVQGGPRPGTVGTHSCRACQRGHPHG